jgi:hypothetical protein
MNLKHKLSELSIEWWVKWGETVITLAHVWVTAHDVSPWYKYTGITVSLLWSYLGYLWREPSLIFLNLFLAAIYLKGILGL